MALGPPCGSLQRSVLCAVALGVLCAVARGDTHLDYTVRFDVKLEGFEELASFTVTVREKKGPIAARHFLKLVHDGFFDGNAFYRVLPGYLVQFGLNGNVTQQRAWDAHGNLRDETHIEQPDWNIRGSLAFVTAGPHTRGTQVYINYDDNHQLDSKGTVTFGRVVDGMATLSAVYAGYRERPQPRLIRARGDAYLRTEYPRLSYIVRARQVSFVEEPWQLSKNSTGLLLTVGMVIGAVLCCGAARMASKNMGAAKEVSSAADDDFRPRDDEDDGEDGEEMSDDEDDMPRSCDASDRPRI